MGVCVACSSEVADEQLTDSLCPNCAGETAAPVEVAPAESPESIEGTEAPAEVPAEAPVEPPVEAPTEAPAEVPAEAPVEVAPAE